MGGNTMSKILDIAHDMARDLLEAGAMDEITMRKMDALCLPAKVSFNPRDIKRIRTKNHVSQAVFAAFIGVMAGLLPSHRAASLDPLEALRHE